MHSYLKLLGPKELIRIKTRKLYDALIIIIYIYILSRINHYFFIIIEITLYYFDQSIKVHKL